MSHMSSPSTSGLGAMGLIGLVLLLVSPWGPCERDELVSSDIDITPVDVDFAHTVYGEGCGQEGCTVYIASPPGPESELYEADRWPFVRLRTHKGDDLSFQVYDGPFFEALMNLKCFYSTSQCVVTTVDVNDGEQYSLAFYNAPGYTHTACVNLSDLRFAVQHDPLSGVPAKTDEEMP